MNTTLADASAVIKDTQPPNRNIQRRNSPPSNACRRPNVISMPALNEAVTIISRSEPNSRLSGPLVGLVSVSAFAFDAKANLTFLAVMGPD